MEYPTDIVQFLVHSPFLLLNFLVVTNWDLVTSFKVYWVADVIHPDKEMCAPLEQQVSFIQQV